MIFKKLRWTLKRHPFLYITRFKLLSKNATVHDIENLSYNNSNPKDTIPDYFNEINELIFQVNKPKEDLKAVKQLSVWLQNHIKGGRGLSEPSEIALKMMLNGEGGVCSDIVQIFNNFCIINDIKVREWGVTRAPFDDSFGGHSFNEVYCNELNKWVLIDAYTSLLFYREGDNIPLSVVEMYKFFRNGDKIIFESFNKKTIVVNENVNNNYFNPNTVPFLVCNYSNKTYDKVLSSARSFMPIFMIHFIVFLLNKSYYYSFPIDDYKQIYS